MATSWEGKGAGALGRKGLVQQAPAIRNKAHWMFGELFLALF